MVHILVREVGEPNCIYGILTAETDDTREVVTEVLNAKAAVAQAEWQIPDLLELLPEEWNVKFDDYVDLYV